MAPATGNAAAAAPTQTAGRIRTGLEDMALSVVIERELSSGAFRHHIGAIALGHKRIAGRR